MLRDVADLKLDDLLSMPGDMLDHYVNDVKQLAIAMSQPVETLTKLSEGVKEGLRNYGALTKYEQGKVVGALLTEIGAEALAEALVIGGVTSVVATPASGAVVGTGVLSLRFGAKIADFYVQMGRVLDRIADFSGRLKKLPDADQVKVLQAVKGMSDGDLNYLSGLDTAGRIDIAALAGQAHDLGFGGDDLAGVVKGIAKGYGCSWASRGGGFWQRVWGVLVPVAYADGCGDFGQRLEGVLDAATRSGIGDKIGTTLKTAAEPHLKSGSTNLGHKFQKHSGRKPDIWGKISGTADTWHDQGMKHFNDVLSGSGKFETVMSGRVSFLEKRLPDGRGVRLNMDGSFKTFID